MEEKRKTFKWAYLIFVGVLAILMIVCTVYVHSLLREYEAAQPTRQAEKALEQLMTDAKQPQAFWEKYGMPTVEGGTYEKGVDIQSAYLALYTTSAPAIIEKTGTHAQDELCYEIRQGNFPLAEVTLRAKGPAVTKLLVFSTREWEIKQIKPLLSLHDYTVTVPDGFTVKAAGMPLKGVKNADGKLQFTVSDVYLQPDFTITNAAGQEASYVVKNFRVLPELYEYTLTLPPSLTVTVNGTADAGETLADGRVRHTVQLLEKPAVTVSDLFGNTVQYEGDALPLTYATVVTPSDYTVTVDGKAVPSAAVRKGVLAEYAFLEGLVQDLPSRAEYDVAILKKDAVLSVTDGAGKPIALKAGEAKYDLTTPLPTAQTVDKAVADKVDVLSVAQSWSLFMSNDRTFSQIETLLHPASYQFEVAQKYAVSEDRAFFSKHTLASPAFTDEAVGNFTKITDTCFSVDIRFVKHMRLTSGKAVDDPMNDRFYFVYSDGKWLLAGLKEVTADA